MIIKKLVMIIGVMFSTVGLADTYFAHGNSCNFRYKNQPSVVHTATGIYNGMSAIQAVQCPLQLREYYSSSAVSEVRYTMINATRLRCRLYGQFFDGTYTAGAEVASPAQRGSGVIVLPRIELNKTLAGLSIRCLLPSGTYINSYTGSVF